MDRYPRILVFTVAAWNSKVGSNTWATLLDQYPRENVANICIREEKPDSNVCSRYFIVSENRVLKSIINRKIGTGYEVQISQEEANSDDLEAHNRRYNEMRKKRRYSMLLAREFVWKIGKWKSRELDTFLDSFKPDVILHSMEGYIHLNRIIMYAIKRTGAKAVGYIWDDNFTYRQSDDCGYKVYRFFQRHSLLKLAKYTNGFFSITNMTKREADDFFGINSVVLTKPLSSIPKIGEYTITYPIQMLYTGKLTIGRDRTIEVLNKALKEINRDGVKILVDIYTPTVLLGEVEKNITDGHFCVVHPAIPQKDALQKQKEADVLLFVEDMDGKDSGMARLSFSTKITDYLSSGKCIFAIGNRNTAPMSYFMENDAAVTANDFHSILSALQQMVDNPAIVREYAQKAMECGIKNHDREEIHKTFDAMIRNVVEEKDEDTLDC